eukprot:114662_1
MSLSQCGLSTEKLQLNGYVYKQSKRLGVFRKRYIVIRNKKLYSYKSDEIFRRNLAHYTEVFDLTIYSKVQVTFDDHSPATLEFTIFSAAGDFRRFRCDSEFEMRTLVNNIREVHHRIQGGHMASVQTSISPVPSRMRRNFGYLNLAQLAEESRVFENGTTRVSA